MLVLEEKNGIHDDWNSDGIVGDSFWGRFVIRSDASLQVAIGRKKDDRALSVFQSFERSLLGSAWFDGIAAAGFAEKMDCDVL